MLKHTTTALLTACMLPFVSTNAYADDNLVAVASMEVKGSTELLPDTDIDSDDSYIVLVNKSDEPLCFMHISSLGNNQEEVEMSIPIASYLDCLPSGHYMYLYYYNKHITQCSVGVEFTNDNNTTISSGRVDFCEVVEITIN